ncbi:ThuA domain-containing protein [Temperatibacter marinus]|uniref:ThuA domain-containing protein n=1 Tax=Temperatibacter marinus TaxID=1456591 RepID=A0AA52EDI9_9PROT|nr:ThuA domain-containing protein [Temperatibacter marinus]WND02715.1 ThuA domain-containing protein [Temperatibacter marinus]
MKRFTPTVIKYWLAATVMMIGSTMPASASQFKVLLFTKTAGWHHETIHDGVSALKLMAKNHDFTLEWHEDSNRITDDFLKSFDVIVFLSTTGDIFNADQQAAMEKFIRSGKGFVGIHAASDTEYDWPWYQKLIGRHFVTHPETQTAKLKVVTRKFPGMSLFPDEILWTDEWYDFSEEAVEGLTYLLTVDESSYDTEAYWGQPARGKGMGKFHPISWYHNFDGGRSFYTALGHTPQNYTNPIFLQHVLGGIYWAATGKGL